MCCMQGGSKYFWSTKQQIICHSYSKTEFLGVFNPVKVVGKKTVQGSIDVSKHMF